MALLAGCDPVGPDFPSGAARVDPPARYRAWWRTVEACAGRRASFDGVRWYHASQPIANRYAAYWFADGNRIVLTGQPLEAQAGFVVRHEMLHAILGPFEPEAHPAEMFLDRCAGVVECIGTCDQRPDASEPAADAPLLGAVALERSLWLSSTVATAASDSGWVSLVVRARNPYPFAVWVHAPSPPEDGRPAALFAYRIEDFAPHPARDVVQSAAPRVAFGPHQVRSWVFDRQVGGDRPLPVGRHRVRATVLGDSTRSALLEVR